MLDSFDKESKLHERRAARARQMRLMEEAASGVPSLLSSAGGGDVTGMGVGEGGGTDRLDGLEPMGGADPAAPPTVSDVADGFYAAHDGTFAIDDDDDDDDGNNDFPSFSNGMDLRTASDSDFHSNANARNLSLEKLGFVYGSGGSDGNASPASLGGGGNGNGNCSGSGSGNTTTNSRRWMDRATRVKDDEESRKLILLASRRVSETFGGGVTSPPGRNDNLRRGRGVFDIDGGDYRYDDDNDRHGMYGNHSRKRARESCPDWCIVQRKLLLAGGMILLLVVILVATLLPGRNNGGDHHESQQPWQTPNSYPSDEGPVIIVTTSPHDHDEFDNSQKPIDPVRFDRIKDRILEHQISHAVDLENENSAQYKALVWIVRDDERQLDVIDTSSTMEGDAELNDVDMNRDGDFDEQDAQQQLFHRYALTVLWFQTSHPDVVADTKKNQLGLTVGDGTAESNRYDGTDNSYSDNNGIVSSNDIQWKQSTNWLSSKGLCLWHGVTCHPHEEYGVKFDGDYHVAILNLTENNLHGILPREVWVSLTKVKALDLSGNELEGTIGREVGELADLEDLFLSSNKFTGSLPAEIGNCLNPFNLYLNDNNLQGSLPSQIGQLTKLRGASLFNNYFQGKIPDEIGDLKDLIALYLDMNQFTGQIPESIGRLESMVDLRLRRNSLSGTLPTELGQLTQIQTLYIDTNPKIKGRIPTQLSNLPKLDELHLYQNNLSGPLPPEFGLLSSLTYLYLDSNELTGSIPDEWGELRNLEQLFLAGNNLEGPIPDTFRAMTSLRYFRASDNDLSGQLPTELGKMEKLEYLYLEENDFESQIPTELGELTKLKLIHLHGNDLTGVMPEQICRLMDDFVLSDLKADCEEPDPDVTCRCCTSCE